MSKKRAASGIPTTTDPETFDDLVKVLQRLSVIEQRLAKIDARLNDIGQKAESAHFQTRRIGGGY